ncbi:MAG: SDR family oxidoreductase [Phyllobacteriaceae bacterium]|nr:SDR family oxidoreductase [Phyllobacteriaceae bacterium]
MPKALVTGGAGAVGEALARALCEEGFDLVLTDRNAAELSAVSARLPKPAETIIADLRHVDDLKRLCDRIEDASSPIDLLINNAGIILPGPVGKLADDAVRAHVEINQTAPMLLCAAAARAMTARGSGAIVSIISLAGIGPMRNSAPYAASKFGLRGFMASLALELRPHGVKVCGVFPSAIDTPMLANELANPDGSPLNFAGNDRPLTPEEVAGQTLRALKRGKLETWLPASDGFIASFLMVFPSLCNPVLGWYERKGDKKKQAYLAALNAGGD